MPSVVDIQCQGPVGEGLVLNPPRPLNAVELVRAVHIAAALAVTSLFTNLVLVMSFDDLVLLLPVRRIVFQRRIAVFDRHPLVGVDGFQVGGLSCGTLLLESIGERDIVGKENTVAHFSQPTPTLMTLILPVRPASDRTVGGPGDGKNATSAVERKFSAAAAFWCSPTNPRPPRVTRWLHRRFTLTSGAVERDRYCLAEGDGRHRHGCMGTRWIARDLANRDRIANIGYVAR